VYWRRGNRYAQADSEGLASCDCLASTKRALGPGGHEARDLLRAHLQTMRTAGCRSHAWASSAYARSMDSAEANIRSDEIVGSFDSAEENKAADSRTDQLVDQLRTVQQQIGQLELADREKKKPWWRQTSLVISILSLTLSASVSLYTQLDQARQRRLDAAKQQAAALDATLSDIVAIRLEDTKQMVALASTNLAAYRAWTTTAAVKRAALIDSAMSEIAKLNGELSPTAALTMGNELIIDGRYPEAEHLLQSGITLAERAKTPTAALLSALAQVYLFPGTHLFDPNRGRALYRKAIDSYPSQADYYVLNTKLNLILIWAVNEHGFANEGASTKLLSEAQSIVLECNLPEAAKTPLQALIDGVRTQLKLQGTGPSLLTSRLIGKWRIIEPDSQSSDLIFIPGSVSGLPTFTKDRISAGRLVERIGGVATMLDQTHMRLDWGAAFDTGVAGLQKTGYSDVALGPDLALHGTDFAVGLPPRTWTARMPPQNRGR
jgi:hypothetical protein